MFLKVYLLLLWIYFLNLYQLNKFFKVLLKFLFRLHWIYSKKWQPSIQYWVLPYRNIAYFLISISFFCFIHKDLAVLLNLYLDSLYQLYFLICMWGGCKLISKLFNKLIIFACLSWTLSPHWTLSSSCFSVSRLYFLDNLIPCK